MFDRNIKNYGKSRRGLRPERLQKKDKNLKQIHKGFVEEADPYVGMVQRSSAAQIITKNRQSQSRLRSTPKKQPHKQNSVNFYINIDKLKNLKITGREKQRLQIQNNNEVKSNSVHHQNRKSLMLRNYNRDKKHQNIYSSYEAASSSLSKIYQPSSQNSNHHNGINIHQKGKMRYKTNTQEQQQPHYKSQTNASKSYLLKRNNFKRNNNSGSNQFKDKTFIQGYLRGKQLGRGGFSKVWEGFHFQSKIFYAIKEIDTQNKYQTHLTEIWFGNYFFKNGQPKQQFESHAGIDNLLTMHAHSTVEPRSFIVYETCDGSLGNMLYDIYEQQGDVEENDQNRLYMIKYKKLYSELRKSTNFLKTLIRSIAQALDLLSENRIVHSDIKTQNILLKRSSDNGNSIFSFKLIDYGSSFQFQSLKQYKLATPEYMCPQLLNFILYQNKKQHYSYMLDYVKQYTNISAIDVWGLGSIILELIHGLPLWLTNPTKILVKGSLQTKRGLFAVSDRSFSKILQRQLYVVENLQYFLAKNNNSGIALDQSIIKVLRGMLEPNPLNRMKPRDIINNLI